MDAARRWAMETFGRYGPLIRSRVAEMVIAEHMALQDAQDASGHRSQGVYGQFWRGMVEKFEEFGDLPDATMVRPGEAPYRLPVINGVVLFPWRYAHNKQTELGATLFVTSDARAHLPTMQLPEIQGALPLALPDPGLSEEEVQLLDALSPGNPEIGSNRLVLVAISSSFHDLSAAQWGEVTITGAGYLETVGYWENLLEVPPSRPASTSPAGSFTDGALPNKFPDADAGTADPAGE
jgi:hypothetical protein